MGLGARVIGKVVSDHSTIHETSADLPMPWPEATAALVHAASRRIATRRDISIIEILVNIENCYSR